MPSGSARKPPCPCSGPTPESIALGGAASVATMLAALGAKVRLVGGVAATPRPATSARFWPIWRSTPTPCSDLADRPTTLKERYIGRAQDRHPQQMIRVDYETRDPIPRAVEDDLIGRLPDLVAASDLVLISDYDKGVCTPRVLRALIRACREAGVRAVADPIRGQNYTRYAGVHCMTPNRLEAQMATGMTIQTPLDALDVGRKLVETLGMDAILVTLDRERDGPGPL